MPRRQVESVENARFYHESKSFVSCRCRFKHSDQIGILRPLMIRVRNLEKISLIGAGSYLPILHPLNFDSNEHVNRDLANFTQLS